MSKPTLPKYANSLKLPQREYFKDEMGLQIQQVSSFDFSPMKSKLWPINQLYPTDFETCSILNNPPSSKTLTLSASVNKSVSMGSKNRRSHSVSSILPNLTSNKKVSPQILSVRDADCQGWTCWQRISWTSLKF